MVPWHDWTMTAHATIRYVMFSAFAVEQGALGYDETSRAAVADDTPPSSSSRRQRVVFRGIYDVAGMRPTPTSCSGRTPSG